MPENRMRLNQRTAFARALSLLRNKKGYKREYLAQKICLSASSIDKMEQGKTSARFADAIIICKALEVELTEFVILYEKELQKLTPPPPRIWKKRIEVSLTL